MVTIFSAGPWQDFIIKQLKAPLLALLELMADKLPIPTKENTHRRNTRILIDLRDEFLKHEEGSSRFKMFKGLWNFFIVLYDFDAYYGDRIDWLLGQWQKTGWELRNKPPGRS